MCAYLTARRNGTTVASSVVAMDSENGPEQANEKL
jgi:hypothetical protein